MRRQVLSAIILLLLTSAAITISAQRGKRSAVPLPSSKVLLTPTAGEPREIGNFPVNAIVSADGNYAVFLEAGYGTMVTNLAQGLAVLDLQTNQISEFPDPRFGRKAKQSFFLGLAFSGDGKHIYASVGSLTDPTGKSAGDTGNGVAVYAFERGRITPERFISIPPQQLAAGKHAAHIHIKAPKGTGVPYPAGLAVRRGDGGMEQLLVADNLSDDALLIDAGTGNVLKRFDLSTSNEIPASYPYAATVSRDSSRAWVSLWNASEVAELDLVHGTIVRHIKLSAPQRATEAGSHPTAMMLNQDEDVLFVTLSNRDEVAAVDTTTGNVLQFMSTRLPGQQFPGTYPDALAIHDHHLLAANASSDAIAVFDVSNVRGPATKATGFIPTEWYPTALTVRGDDLIVASGKSKGAGPNAMMAPDNPESRNGHPYIATLMHGSVARVSLSSALKQLPELTSEVAESNLMNGRSDHVAFAGGESPIRHVIYIIKENRTYDQLFGDLGVGNGDKSLTMYGENITPNQHKLARQFGVLDNFYDSGEVSGDGHVWSTTAISSDYTERTWQIAYRGNERTYDYEGEVAEEFPILQGIPDVNEPGSGYLWTNFARHGITYRHYGEYVATRWCDRGEEMEATPQEGTPVPEPERCAKSSIKPGEQLPEGAANPWPWPIPLLAENVPTKPELRDHFDPHYPDFRLEFPDQLRVDEFLREFNGWVNERKSGRSDPMPQFILLRLPNDHTSGTKPGVATPSAAIADNDLAVGRVADALSHSPFWDDSAMFVLEDDAQNGADHVDAHRSIALVISKYAPGSTQQPFVDHRFYTTVNMIHTMEALVGAPPMNNNDSQAALMSPLFSGNGTQPPFAADYRNRDNKLLYEMNKAKAEGAKQSAAMDFTHADAADSSVLNAILWRDRMGARPMPAAKHTLFPQRERVERDDD